MATIHSNPIRVILVDDNPDIVDSLKMFLELLGFQVTGYLDGFSALEEVSQFCPHACIIDINMPQMNGYELARKLREHFPNQPLVLATVTAIEDPNHFQRALEAGFDLQFRKPVDPVEISTQIQAFLCGNPHQNGSLLRNGKGACDSLLENSLPKLSQTI